MSLEDQRRFTSAVAQAKSEFWGGTMGMLTDAWRTAFHECSRLAMYDMLQALNSVSAADRRFMLTDTQPNPRRIMDTPISPSDDRIKVLGAKPFARIRFAVVVIDFREIVDFGLNAPDQVNDGREFLGCTRLEDVGVQQRIDAALAQGRSMVPAGPLCYPAIGKAWTEVLVPQRRAGAGSSLIANLAAAAHYMLARYHVCKALASVSQMQTVVDGYDANKRIHIATGDRDLKGVALTGQRPFPPDFDIRRWAYLGAEHGETDRKSCNASASPPLIFPDVNGQEL